MVAEKKVRILLPKLCEEEDETQNEEIFKELQNFKLNYF